MPLYFIRDGPYNVERSAGKCLHGPWLGNFQGPAEGADHFPGAPGYPRYVGDSNCALIKAVGSEVRAGAPRRLRVLRHSGRGALE